MKTWLVEIRVKDWIHVEPGVSRVVDYVEVELLDYQDEFNARGLGYAKFCELAQYTPSIRKKLESMNIATLANNICAPDAVCLD